MSDQNATTILITGVTGYVGGRLVDYLLERGYRIRVMSRDRSRLRRRPWSNQVETVEADVFDVDSLHRALRGIDVAYYFIHSMSGKADDHFVQKDIEAARNFASVAREEGADRIIYLGGLGGEEDHLSKHLKSRQETGRVLREYGPDVTEFRAAVIVGSGSKSFEMIRYLTERVPIMICPSWVYSKIQPIAIRDVLKYLTATIEKPDSRGEIIEIGGADIQTYASMMTEYARIRGLRRWLIPIPLLTPRLSSYWVHWMTPIPASLARPLIEGVRNNVTVQSDKASSIFPEIRPMEYETAVQRALERFQEGSIESSWSDSLTSSQGGHQPVTLQTQEGLIIERRQLQVEASPEEIYDIFTGFGGRRGWPAWNWAWRIRGIFDRLLGGVGFRRGRRDPDEVRPGDAIDFWRVEDLEPQRMLRLRAEMKLPGKAWLEFRITDDQSEAGHVLTQTAYFAPKGLAGIAYWYLLYPIHRIIFSQMIKAVKRDAEKQQ